MSELIAKIYPEDALALQGSLGLEQANALDAINSSDASTLDELFRERVRRSADKIAYTQFDEAQQQWLGVSWANLAREVERWQVALRGQGLEKGDRVAICHRNSIEWVVFDQAALRLGLVVVPLYKADRPENIAYVLNDSGSKLALFSGYENWQEVAAFQDQLSSLNTVLLLQDTGEAGKEGLESASEKSFQVILEVDQWLPEVGQHFERGVTASDDLASIVYTSGTTGRPKGVMLSHKNMLSNAYSGMRSVALKPSDRLLSFLPLSHTLERTVGYYAAMLCAASVTFNRSIPELSADLSIVKPTVLISVPRIFERVHNKIYTGMSELSYLKRHLFRRAIKTGWQRFQYRQGVSSWHPRILLWRLLDAVVAKPIRERLGGKLDFVIVGGAPLSQDVAKTFISLGVPLLQGYGLTECSPVVSVNTKSRNKPDSIGLPLRGVEVCIQENDEIWVKGDNVMMGYWGQPEATAKTLSTLDGETWLRTGDRGSIDEKGFIRIIGRIKDILVLANGEKVPPPDIEAAILRDSLFEHAMIAGEGKSFLSAIVVLNETQWLALSDKLTPTIGDINSKEAHDLILERIAAKMNQFPGYARIRRVHVSTTNWTVESGLVTPTLKIKRPKLLEHYRQEIDQMYVGRGVRKG